MEVSEAKRLKRLEDENTWLRRLLWDATVFCKIRDRLLDGDIAAKFLSLC